MRLGIAISSLVLLIASIELIEYLMDKSDVSINFFMLSFALYVGAYSLPILVSIFKGKFFLDRLTSHKKVFFEVVKTMILVMILFLSYLTLSNFIGEENFIHLLITNLAIQFVLVISSAGFVSVLAILKIKNKNPL